MEITPEDITKAIDGADGSQDDYGHEVRVGRLLRAYWLTETLHGETYLDPITKKARQFDFRWRSPPNEVVVSLAVECKNIHFPIVVAGSQRTGRESFHELVESRKGGRFRTPAEQFASILDVPSASVIRTVYGDNSLYPACNFVGKKVIQLTRDQKGNYGRGRDSEIYDPWSQALASCHDLVHSARQYVTRFSEFPHVFTLILPVVVLPNDTLWYVEYDPSGQPKGDPVTTNACEFYVAHKVTAPAGFGDVPGSYRLSHLHFLTMNGLAEFLRRIAADDEWLRLAFNKDTIADAKAERC